ncbi:MAG: hypothetical protein O3A21_04555 [Proteobacteria bacterium]|nr:hypothetical protein [Pseudomonadota bacterium]
MIRKEVIVRDDPITGFAGVVRAGPLLFTSGCDGHRDPRTNAIDPALAGQGGQQSANSYGSIKRLLALAGSHPSAVARIDHFTSSQDWIAERQIKRAEYFGRPSPHGSTGVAAKMSGLNMLTTAVIAVADTGEHEVLVAGVDYAIGHISSLVRAGPLLFLSGIRGTLDPRSGAPIAEETTESFAAQTHVCYEVILDILARRQFPSEAIVRLDRYLRNRNLRHGEAAICRSVVGKLDAVSTLIPLPMGMHGEVEITALGVVDPSTKEICAKDREGRATSLRAGGFVFVGECAGTVNEETGAVIPELAGNISGQIDHALHVLDARLQAARATLDSVVRLEVYLRDIYLADEFLTQVRGVFGADPPAIIIAGAELEGFCEIKLNAIAV